MELTHLDRLIERTDGVSGEFIRELLRKAAVFAAGYDGESPLVVRDGHIEEALAELLVAGGAPDAKHAGAPPRLLHARRIDRICKTILGMERVGRRFCDAGIWELPEPRPTLSSRIMLAALQTVDQTGQRLVSIDPPPETVPEWITDSRFQLIRAPSPQAVPHAIEFLAGAVLNALGQPVGPPRREVGQCAGVPPEQNVPRATTLGRLGANARMGTALANVNVADVKLGNFRDSQTATGGETEQDQVEPGIGRSLGEGLQLGQDQGHFPPGQDLAAVDIPRSEVHGAVSGVEGRARFAGRLTTMSHVSGANARQLRTHFGRSHRFSRASGRGVARKSR